MEIVIAIDETVPEFARHWLGSEVTELVEQIEEAVRCGALRPGDLLPSTRQLANDLDLDEKTVAKAYRLLQRGEVIGIRGCRGAYVVRNVTRRSPPPRCRPGPAPEDR